jgi:diguanylate cyclase (GGDEF)-like protein
MLLSNFTLLYVEDNIDAQNYIKLLLEDDVREFYQAYNGEEAMAIYTEKKPDIILTDINMPFVSGIELAKKIKSEDSDQIILIMSSFDDQKTLLESINIGVDGFIPKPVDMDMLNNMLQDMAEKLQNKLDSKNKYSKKIDNLYNLAHYDNLTKIANMSLFNVKLKQSITNAQRYNSSMALFFIDLDHFKDINDRYGHKAGDFVLQSVVKNILRVIRNEDILARRSGDEFLLIIEGVDSIDDLEVMADKILKATSTTVEFNDKSIQVCCSIGISRYPQDTIDIDELPHFADIAMYKAKKSGKCQFEFYKRSNQ